MGKEGANRKERRHLFAAPQSFARTRTGVPEHFQQWKLDAQMKRIITTKLARALEANGQEAVAEAFRKLGDEGFENVYAVKSADRDVLLGHLSRTQVRLMADYLEAQGVKMNGEL